MAQSKSNVIVLNQHQRIDPKLIIRQQRLTLLGVYRLLIWVKRKNSGSAIDDKTGV